MGFPNSPLNVSQHSQLTNTHECKIILDSHNYNTLLLTFFYIVILNLDNRFLNSETYYLACFLQL